MLGWLAKIAKQDKGRGGMFSFANIMTNETSRLQALLENNEMLKVAGLNISLYIPCMLSYVVCMYCILGDFWR